MHLQLIQLIKHIQYALILRIKTVKIQKSHPPFQNPQSILLPKMSTQTKPLHNHPQKMLQFLNTLYTRYPILPKLTQKQSQAFNNELIILLVDQNQNVDPIAYQQIVHNLGMDTFVLNLVTKCIDRNPCGIGGYQMKREMAALADNLEKETKELARKMKIVQRKEAELNAKEAGLRNRVREYAGQLEKQSIGRLIGKEMEIRKHATGLINSLKAKEKIINERREEIQLKLAELATKYKNIQVKEKQLSKRCPNTTQSAPISQNQPSNQVIKVNNPISTTTNSKQYKQLLKKLEQCKYELEKLKKKYRTTEMAYSKAKGDIGAKQKENQMLIEKVQELSKQLDIQKIQRIKQNEREKVVNQNKIQQPITISNPKIRAQQNNKQKFSKISNIKIKKQKQNEWMDMLQMLEISQIDPQNNNLKQLEEHQEGQRKLPQTKDTEVKKLRQQEDEDEDEDEEQPRNFGIKPSQSCLYKAQSSSQQEQCEIQIPNFLKTDPTPSQLLQKITSVLQSPCPPSSSPTLTLLQSNHLLSFTQLPSFTLTKPLLTSYLDLLLTLIQQSNPHYYELVQYLSHHQFVTFFQQTYLSYESVLEITEATTLLLSRILMATTKEIGFSGDFVRAITVRAKLVSAGTGQGKEEEFLEANINCLLSMIPI